MRRLQGAREVEPPLGLAEQFRPELAEAVQGQVEMAAELLVQLTLPFDPVVPQAQVQGIEQPALACALGPGLEQRGLATQLALEVEVGIQLQPLLAPGAVGLQLSGEGSRQFGEPEGGIQSAQGQLAVPADTVGEIDLHLAFGLALPGLELQVGQGDAGQVARHRAAQAEITGRALEHGVEAAFVAGLGVAHFGIQLLHVHRRRRLLGEQPLPGEVAPLQAAVDGERLLPVDAALQRQGLLRITGEQKLLDIGTAGVDAAREVQHYRATLPRQTGLALYRITRLEVAPGAQLHLGEGQSFRQVGTGLEAVGPQRGAGRQVVCQGPQLAVQTAIEVTAAVGLQLEHALQVAVGLQRQLPGHLTGRRQLQAACHCQRPVALGTQSAVQFQRQLIATQAEPLQLQPLCLPARHQLQLLQLVVAIEHEVPDTHLSDLQGQGQAQLRQAEGAGVSIGSSCRQIQRDAVAGQFIDAQGATQQATGGPLQQRRLHPQGAAILLPDQAPGAPASAQYTVEVLHRQPRHPLQQPAAAGFREQQDGRNRHHPRQDGGQPCEADFQRAPHSSGPMEKWMR
ncbi:hypothetical protein D9M72_276160 [compost metagenome]